MIRLLGRWLVNAIIRHARKYPFWHLDGYMNRFWLLGFDCEWRNDSNPNWHDERELTRILEQRKGRLQDFTVELHYAEGVRAAREHLAEERGIAYRVITHFLGIRLHQILRSDNDRHLHDHPFASISIVLRGGYWETMPLMSARQVAKLPTGTQEPTREVWRGPGAIVLRRASSRHRLRLPDGRDCWSIFIMSGRKHRPDGKPEGWGFYVPGRGKIPRREYFKGMT